MYLIFAVSDFISNFTDKNMNKKIFVIKIPSNDNYFGMVTTLSG